MSDEKKQNPFENLDSSERETSQAAPSNAGPNANASELPPYSPPQFSHPTQPAPVQGAAASYYGVQPAPYPAEQYAGQPSSSTQPPILNQKRPIAIPAIDSANASPFLRAYAPILETCNLPKESFYTFLDQLNDVVTTSPPMQVLDATGGILKSVPILFPLHWIGSAVSGLANLGGHGISKSRSDSALKQANKEIFGPRGLKAEIAKLDAVAHIANIPILDSQGKVNRQAPLIRQLNDLSYPAPDESHELDLQQKRLRVLQPWIADLSVDTLPWTSKSKLHRFNAALKKRNNPEGGESSRRRDQKSGEQEEDDSGFRKLLWLVIREAEPADAKTRA